MKLYSITFTTESGDEIEGGYWKLPPTVQEVTDVLERDLPDCEWLYIKNLIADGCWSSDFWTVNTIDASSEPRAWYVTC